MNKHLIAALTALLLLISGVPAYGAATLDKGACSTADKAAGNPALCTGQEQLDSINQEINHLYDLGAPVAAYVSGTNDIIANTTPSTTVLVDGALYQVKPGVTNTGAVRLNLNSLGLISVTNAAGSALVANDLQSTSVYILRYYSGLNQFRVLSPLGAGSQPLDAELTCLSGLTSAADKFAYFTGSGTCSLADLSSAFRTWLTTSSAANLASVLTDEAAGWATFQTTPTVANLGSFLTNEASGWATFVVTPSMANLSAFLSDDASGWATFGTTPSSANARALYTDEQGSGPAMFGVTAVTCSNTDRVSAISATGTATCSHINESICVALSDETTTITTGTAKTTFRMPYAFTLTNIRGSLNTVSSSGSPIFDVNEGGTSVMTTNKVLIDVSELTSVTAVTAVTITDTTLADDANMTVDIDVAGTGAKGAKVCLIGYQT